MAEPIPGVNPINPVTPGQDPGKPLDPPKPADTPVPGVKPAEPGSQTDPAQLLAALKQVREELKETKEASKATEEALRLAQASQAQQSQQSYQQQEPNQQQMIHQQIKEAWDAGDPEKAVNMMMAVGFQWYDTINAGLDHQKDQVRGRYSDFNKYESAAMSYIRTLPLNQRGAPGVLEMAYLIEKGKMSDQITKTATQTAVEEAIRRIQAGEQIQGFPAGGGTPPVSNVVQLTIDQSKAAEMMGLTPQQYMEGLKK